MITMYSSIYERILLALEPAEKVWGGTMHTYYRHEYKNSKQQFVLLMSLLNSIFRVFFFGKVRKRKILQ